MMIECEVPTTVRGTGVPYPAAPRAICVDGTNTRFIGQKL